MCSMYGLQRDLQEVGKVPEDATDMYLWSYYNNMSDGNTGFGKQILEGRLADKGINPNMTYNEIYERQYGQPVRSFNNVDTKVSANVNESDNMGKLGNSASLNNINTVNNRSLLKGQSAGVVPYSENNPAESKSFLVGG